MYLCLAHHREELLKMRFALAAYVLLHSLPDILKLFSLADEADELDSTSDAMNSCLQPSYQHHCCHRLLPASCLGSYQDQYCSKRFPPMPL